MSLGLFASTLRVLKTLKTSTTEQSDRLLQAVSTKLIDDGSGDFSHIFQRKSRLQLVLLSCAVCGIEFCYAAETAFVSPTLLKIGVPVMYMSLIWCLSPLLGLFLVPILGSMSDKCRWKLGRRRPFILMLSVGIILGLLFVPNGEIMGKALGDIYKGNDDTETHEVTDNPIDYVQTSVPSGFNPFLRKVNSITDTNDTSNTISLNNTLFKNNNSFELRNSSFENQYENNYDNYVNVAHPWSIVFTVIGVVLLDFSCDACQSPCRTYLLDVSVPEDHSLGLSTFTVMAGLGGSLGYVMGGINWEKTHFGESLGGHVKVVFTMVLFIYLVCVTLTVSSVKEVPLDRIGITAEQLQKSEKSKGGGKYKKFVNESDSLPYEKHFLNVDKMHKENDSSPGYYGTTANPNNPFKRSHSDTYSKAENGDAKMLRSKSSVPRISLQSYDDSDALTCNGSNEENAYDMNHFAVNGGHVQDGVHKTSVENGCTIQNNSGESVVTPVPMPSEVSLKTYLISIVKMPRSLFILCLTNLWCWMSLVCYSLYFTDFVGQAVYDGDPSSHPNSEAHLRYDEGVRMGSFAMSLYSISCSAYSLCIETLVEKLGAKTVYIGSQLVYTIGAALMAITKHRITVFLLSPCAGVMYATLFTMPYLLVAHYHSRDTFHENTSESDKNKETEKQIRGIGTDVAVVSSMVFFAQFILSSIMGSIVHAMKSTVAVPICASVLSFLGAITASQVLYLGL